MLPLRIIFFAPTFAGLIWGFGFAIEALASSEPSAYTYIPLAAASTVALGAFLLRRWPEFLAFSGISTSSVVFGVLRWTLIAYLVSAFFMYALTLAILQPWGASDGDRGELFLFSWLIAIWLPLWFSPALGTVLGWWRVKSKFGKA